MIAKPAALKLNVGQAQSLPAQAAYASTPRERTTTIDDLCSRRLRPSGPADEVGDFVGKRTDRTCSGVAGELAG